MFWLSSNNQRYESSDSESDSSADAGSTSWSRPRTSNKKRSSKSSPPLNDSWFSRIFNTEPPSPPPKRSHHTRHRRTRKTRSRTCRPKTSHSWGIFLLTVLLVVYLIDFFKLLYSGTNAPQVSLHQPVTAETVSSSLNVANEADPVGTNGAINETVNSVETSSSQVGEAGQMPNDINSSDSGTAQQAQNEILSTNARETSQTQGENNPTGPEGRPSDRETTDGTSYSSSTGSSTSTATSSGTKDWHEAVNAAMAPVGSQQGNGGNDESDIKGEELKHPMNRNMPELSVPGKTGSLSADAVKNYYRNLVKAYLSTFRNGIYRQLYFDILRRRTYALTPPGANKGIQSMLFQIIDRKVYLMDPYEVPRNSKPFYRTRINEVIWLLSKLASEGRIKNTEFLMSIHDCVQTVNQPHKYRGAHFQESNPSFTIVNCNFSNNIPFPMWEGSRNRDGGFSGWDEEMRKYAEDDTPWDKKTGKAVFRGGNRPSMYFRNKSEADEHCAEVGRTRLLHLSQQHPDMLDVSIGGTCGGQRTQLERLEPKDHHKFKYILYAEGNCMWADRTRQQVFGPSLLIMQETPCGQFFEPLLKPFVHYVPTDFFFTDTLGKIKWAREHDDESKTIIKNANEFAHNFLSLSGIEAYVEVLLEEYTNLLVEPDVKLENGAVDVTNKQGDTYTSRLFKSDLKRVNKLNTEVLREPLLTEWYTRKDNNSKTSSQYTSREIWLWAMLALSHTRHLFIFYLYLLNSLVNSFADLMTVTGSFSDKELSTVKHGSDTRIDLSAQNFEKEKQLESRIPA